MSGIQSAQIGEEVVLLLPSEIQTISRYNVRPFSSSASSEDEDKRIEQLALSIETQGQFDSVLITPEHVLVAGHRRRRAVILINERRSARGRSLLRLVCAVDRTGGDMRRKAIQSNLQRRQTSVMDLAYLIVQIREENDWRAWKGTQQVAAYLGIDPSTVVAAERFLGAEKDLQNRLHEGLISAQSAADVMKAAPDPKERAELLERAAVIQTENRTERIMSQFATGKLTKGAAAANLEKLGDELRGPAKRIQHPAVVAAIRERHATARVHPARRMTRSRAELLEALSHFDKPRYPLPVRQLFRFLVEQFATGAGSLDELRELVLALAEMPPPEVEEQPHRTVAN